MLIRFSGHSLNFRTVSDCCCLMLTLSCAFEITNAKFLRALNNFINQTAKRAVIVPIMWSDLDLIWDVNQRVVIVLEDSGVPKSTDNHQTTGYSPLIMPLPLIHWNSLQPHCHHAQIKLSDFIKDNGLWHTRSVLHFQKMKWIF